LTILIHFQSPPKTKTAPRNPQAPGGGASFRHQCPETLVHVEHQRLGLLDGVVGGELVEHVLAHQFVDIEQRDGVAAFLFAAELEVGDVDAGVAEASSP
jgi:hypothetical protein